MAGGRRIPVTVEADTDGDFDKAARGLDDVEKSALKADKSLSGLTKGHHALDAEINKNAASVKNLREEFLRTGDVDLLRDASKLERARKGLEKLRTEFDLVGNSSTTNSKKMGLLDFALDEWIAKTSKSALNAISGGLPGVGGLSSSMTTALVAGAAAAAPAIGAAINAGVLLGVGGGALAAGIIAAAYDPNVQAAYRDLGGFVVQTFRTASEPLVEPLLRGSARFEDVWLRALPGIQAGMAKLAPVVDHLVSGVAGFAEKIGPGFGRAFDASLPVLNQLADELPRLGSAMSSFFDSMARGGPGAVEFFRDLMAAIDLTIVNLGYLVEGLSKVYEFGHSTFGQLLSPLGMLSNLVGDSGDKADKSAGDYQLFTDSLKKAGDEASRTSDLAHQVGFAAQVAGLGAQVAKQDFSTLSSAIADAGSTSDMLAGKMTDRLMGTLLGMSHATLGVQQGLLNLKDAFDQNGLAIDRHTGRVSMNTKAGLANREAVLAAIEGNLRMYDAQIASGVGADVATQKYEDNTRALHDQLRAAGLTEQQVGDLIGEYGRVPGKVNTAIATQGLTEAINNLNTLLRQLLGLPTYKRITIDQVTLSRRIDQGNLLPGGYRVQRWGGVTEHAEIGLLRDAQVYSAVSSGARYAFAEPSTQGEAFIPKNGNPARSMGILSKAASWYGAAVVPSGYGAPVTAAGGRGGGAGGVNLTLSASGSGTPFEQAMATWVMYAVRTGLIQLETEAGGRVTV